MTISEKVLWERLRHRRTGFVFRSQYPVGNYFLDFYCPEATLCVEVDGELHAAQLVYDSARDARLAELGILTLRIPSVDLFDPNGLEIGRWMREIVEVCEKRAGRPGNECW